MDETYSEDKVERFGQLVRDIIIPMDCDDAIDSLSGNLAFLYYLHFEEDEELTIEQFLEHVCDRIKRSYKINKINIEKLEKEQENENS